jgi:hypothetical protein
VRRERWRRRSVWYLGAQRTEFSNRELRLDPAIPLPDHRPTRLAIPTVTAIIAAVSMPTIPS